MGEQIKSQGANIDTRPPELRVKDYSADEVAGAGTPPEPFKNSKPTKLGVTEFNQWYTSSCVPHGFWTQLEYKGIIDASFKPSQLRTYRKRSNYPSEGSNGTDIYDRIREGQSNDYVTPNKCLEATANALPLVLGDKKIKDFKYFQYIDKKTGKLQPEKVPADVALGEPVAIFIFATNDEWSQEYVKIKSPNLGIGEAAIRHCVCIIPKGDFTENGKKWLAVQDSAKFGGRGLRYMEYDFFLKRSYFAAKVAAADIVITPPAPIGKPTTACELGDKGDAVKSLQAFLVKQGKLEAQYVTGNYGALTAKAVLWWQLENWQKFTGGVPQLLEYAGKYWGKQSIDIINNQ